MALRRMISFDRLPKGILAAAGLPGGINRGNGMSFMADPVISFIPNPVVDAVNINEGGWINCANETSRALRDIRFNSNIYSPDATVRYFACRMSMRSTGTIVATNWNMIALNDTGPNTERMALLNWTEMSPILGGAGTEVFIEIVFTIDDENKLIADIYLNNVHFKNLKNNTTNSGNYLKNATTTVKLGLRPNISGWQSKSINYRDIVMYDDVSEGEGSLVSRTGPIRIKPIYFDAVMGEGWTATQGLPTDVVNTEISANVHGRPYIYNDTNENPLSMTIKTDLDRNLPIFGVTMDVTLNTEMTSSIGYDLKLTDSGVDRELLTGVATQDAVWGTVLPPVDTDSSGKAWTVDSLNGVKLTLNVKSNPT